MWKGVKVLRECLYDACTCVRVGVGMDVSAGMGLGLGGVWCEVCGCGWGCELDVTCCMASGSFETRMSAQLGAKYKFTTPSRCFRTFIVQWVRLPCLLTGAFPLN